MNAADEPLTVGPTLVELEVQSSAAAAERPDSDLALSDLAQRINSAAKAAETHAKSAMQAAFEVGALLNQAKAKVEHGKWECWLLENCRSIAPRTAQSYMRLAKKVPLLPDAEAQRVAYLPVREAIRAIATTPGTPKSFSSARKIRATSANQAKETSAALRKGMAALKETAYRVDHIVPISKKGVEVLRAKLGIAVAALDALLGG